MVAYSFKRQFEAPIRAGDKRQTIRADRKRHARPGEAIQLFTGMRTRSCRKIGAAVCVSVEPILIDFGDRCQVAAIQIGPQGPDGRYLCGEAEIEAFARADGFADWQALADFWAENHDIETDWIGVLITWTDFQPEGEG